MLKCLSHDALLSRPLPRPTIHKRMHTHAKPHTLARGLTSYSREPMLLLLSPAAASGAPAICLVHVSHACGITAHQPAHERAAEPGVLCAHPDVCRHALTQTIAWRPACADQTKLPSHLRRPRGSPRDQGAMETGLRARQVDNPTEFWVSTGQRSSGASRCNMGVHSWHARLYATMSESSSSEGPIHAATCFESAASRAVSSRSSAQEVPQE